MISLNVNLNMWKVSNSFAQFSCLPFSEHLPEMGDDRPFVCTAPGCGQVRACGFAFILTPGFPFFFFFLFTFFLFTFFQCLLSLHPVQHPIGITTVLVLALP